MARGSKEAYISRQKRQERHIEKDYKKKGTPTKKAQRIAWATVNKQEGSGKRSGSGRRSIRTLLRATRRKYSVRIRSGRC